MDNIFLPTKKRSEKTKIIAAARLADIMATRWTGNRIYFMDSLGDHCSPTWCIFSVKSQII